MARGWHNFHCTPSALALQFNCTPCMSRRCNGNSVTFLNRTFFEFQNTLYILKKNLDQSFYEMPLLFSLLSSYYIPTFAWKWLDKSFALWTHLRFWLSVNRRSIRRHLVSIAFTIICKLFMACWSKYFLLKSQLAGPSLDFDLYIPQTH